MKKATYLIAILAIMAFALFSMKDSFKGYKVTARDGGVKSEILFKGLRDAVDFTMDNEGKYYIAFKDRIQYIDKVGKSYNVFINNKLSITSLDYNNEVLYYASGTCVYAYNLISKENKEIIKDIPNYGDYNSSLIKIYGEYLFVTIGSATNSGVVGPDNMWLDEYPQNHDITPKSITIKGVNFGDKKTGSFVSYKTRNTEGQIITEHEIGNSSIIIYNLKTGDLGNFAWGIRNMKGIDFSSEGKIITVVGGMENRGLRPVEGDSDYIYQIKKNAWYGFPDYTGGDEVSSPKFKGVGNSTINFILDQHPTTNPPAPIYQHTSVNSLVGLTIDKSGKLGSIDCIYFYEKNDNSIYSLDKSGALKEKISFEKNAYISSIKVFNNLLVLDSKNGYLISVGKNENSATRNITKKVICYLLVVVIALIVSILMGLNKKNSM
jgi:glucose/arabinose dehydrogenase